MVSEGDKRGRDRPKITYKEVISKDLQILGISTDLHKDRCHDLNSPPKL